MNAHRLAYASAGPDDLRHGGDRPLSERGGPIEINGAAPNRFMVHIALNEVDDEHPAADWGDQVSDDEYAAAPSV